MNAAGQIGSASLAISWPLLMFSFSVVGLPIARMVFTRPPLCGLVLSKLLGYLLFAFVGWSLLHSGWFENTRSFAALLAYGLALLSGIWLWRSGQLAGVFAQWRWLLGIEAVYLVAFWGFLALRSNMPGVLNFEQPFDYGLLNAAMSSPVYPPNDPWLAGQTLNYYYFGHAAAGLAANAAGVHRLLAYDAALANTFALGMLGAFGLSTQLAIGVVGHHTRALARFLSPVAGVPLLLIGNLAALPYLLGIEANSPRFTEGLSWRASRVISQGADGAFRSCSGGGALDCPITEFPAFSFILGDLHAHLLAIPLVLLQIALALQWFHLWRHGSPGWVGVGAVLVGGANAGLLWMTNSWDLPGSLLLLLGAGILAILICGQPDARIAGWLLAHWLAVLIIAVATALPFLTNYEAPRLGLAITQHRSQIGPFLLMWGIPIAIYCTWLLAGGWAINWRLRLGAFTILALATLGFELSVGGAAPVLLLGLVGIAASAFGSLPASSRAATGPIMGLAGYGFLILLVPEFIHIDDGFGGAWERLNTVFKFFFHAWIVLLAITPAMIGGLFRAVMEWPSARLARVGSLAGAGVLITLLGIGSFYTVDAAPARAADFDGQSLNALRSAEFSAGGDVEVANWIARNLDPESTILEACCESYSQTGRMAAWTGIPTVFAWQAHCRMHRPDCDLTAPDPQLIQRLYDGLGGAKIAARLRELGITHVVVGNQERFRYPSLGDPSRTELIEAYSSTGGQTRLYAVPYPTQSGEQ